MSTKHTNGARELVIRRNEGGFEIGGISRMEKEQKVNISKKKRRGKRRRKISYIESIRSISKHTHERK